MLGFYSLTSFQLLTLLESRGCRHHWVWIRDFLTNRSHVVRIGDRKSFTLILNIGRLQGCVLSLVLFTHDYSAIHSSIMVLKFADDTTVVSIIKDNDETHDREEIQHLTVWCLEDNLFLNTSKTSSRWSLWNIRGPGRLSMLLSSCTGR